MRLSPRCAVHMALLATLAAAPVAAQLQVGTGYRTDRYFGSLVTSTIEDGSRIRFRPLRPDVFDLSLHRQLGRIRVGLIGSTFVAGLAGESESDGITIQGGGTFDVLELAAEAGITLSGNVRVVAGPVIGLWRTEGTANRTVVGAQAGIDFEAPIGGAFRIFGRATGGVVGSPIDPTSLGDTQERGTLSRRSLVTGVRMQL